MMSSNYIFCDIIAHLEFYHPSLGINFGKFGRKQITKIQKYSIFVEGGCTSKEHVKDKNN